MDTIKIFGRRRRDVDGNDTPDAEELVDELPCTGTEFAPGTPKALGAGVTRPLVPGEYSFRGEAYGNDQLRGGREDGNLASSNVRVRGLVQPSFTESIQIVIDDR